MAKSKKKVSDKMIGVMIGIAITLSIIGLISSLSISSAHSNRNGHNTMNDDGMYNMMSSNMEMMHAMMMGDSGMMGCMQMMNDAMSDGSVTEEEMQEMMQQMDKDGDGQCDYCGMSIEACRKMMSS